MVLAEGSTVKHNKGRWLEGCKAKFRGVGGDGSNIASRTDSFLDKDGNGLSKDL